MTGLLLLLSIAVLVLVFCEGFFSGSETVFTSVSRAFLHSQAESGNPRAALAQRLINKTERFLGTTLMGTNLAVVSSTTISQFLISTLMPGKWESLLNTLIMTPLILVIGELIPKSLGRAYSDPLALRLAKPLRVAEIVLYPLVVVISKVAGLMATLSGGALHEGSSPYVTREDLQAMAELAVEQGLVPGPSGNMLQTVFTLDTQPVSAIMVPLVDVALVPDGAPIDSVAELSVKTGFSRFPVYRDRVDEIIGVVDLRKLLYECGGPSAPPDLGSTPITPFVQTNIAFVPETKAVGALLHEIRYQKIPMAVVVDEHGGVVGIVTHEDLIEEIVGEIHDERDGPAHDIVQIAESVYECDGRLSAKELAEALDVQIDSDGFETAGGLVLKLAGRIPAPGDRFHCSGYEIEVVDVVKRRVARLRFRRPQEQP